MSWDFMVFEPDAAPRERKAFMTWFQQVTDWDMEANHDDPRLTSPRLRAWFDEMKEIYPPLNGPFEVAEEHFDDPKVTDYTITPTLIYAGFVLSEADAAMKLVKRLAFAHGLGFFDPQAGYDGVYLPDLPGSGRLKPSGPWWLRLLGLP